MHAACGFITKIINGHTLVQEFTVKKIYLLGILELLCRSVVKGSNNHVNLKIIILCCIKNIVCVHTQFFHQRVIYMDTKGFAHFSASLWILILCPQKQKAY